MKFIALYKSRIFPKKISQKGISSGMKKNTTDQPNYWCPPRIGVYKTTSKEDLTPKPGIRNPDG